MTFGNGAVDAQPLNISFKRFTRHLFGTAASY